MRAGRFDEALRHQTAAAESLRERRQTAAASTRRCRRRSGTLYWQGDTSAAAEACRRALDVADTDRAARAHAHQPSAPRSVRVQMDARPPSRLERPSRSARVGSRQSPPVWPRTRLRGSHHGRYRLAARGMRRLPRSLVAETRVTQPPCSVPQRCSDCTALHGFDVEQRSAAFGCGQRAESHNTATSSCKQSSMTCEAPAALMRRRLRKAASTRASAVSAPSIADDPYCLSMAALPCGNARRGGRATRTAAIELVREGRGRGRRSAAHYAHLNASVNLAFCSGSRQSVPLLHYSPTSRRRARELDLLFVALKADFFAADAALSQRKSRRGPGRLERVHSPATRAGPPQLPGPGAGA